MSEDMERLRILEQEIALLEIQLKQKRGALTPQDRVDAYAASVRFPLPLFVGGDGRIVGTWVMGNNYTVASGYYGGYPHGYLVRLRALFPEKRKVLHVFSGHVDLDALPGDTVDLNADLHPTYVDDAQTLSMVPVEEYDLIAADPPYSVEDAEHYQTSMVHRNRVINVLGQRLRSGAHVAWLDQVLPMYRKEDFEVIGYIGVVKSTNHRFRVVTLFEKR